MRINEHFYQSSESYKAPADLAFYDVKKHESIAVHGLYDYKAQMGFPRMPKSVAEATNARVACLYSNPAGGRVRFKTDSGRIAIRAKYPNLTPRTILTGQVSTGFDIYIRENGIPTFYAALYPPVDMTEDGYEKCVPLKEGEKEIEIYLPIYNDLQSLEIGLDAGARLEAPTPYSHSAPILYYGSSITQGASASRPGNVYSAILARRFDTDFLNLGFAGGACGEAAIAEYMASLSPSVFVCDYDYNAPSVEHLAATHLPLYRTMRAAHPELPIILITKPILLACGDNPDNDRRREIIYETYRTARAEGDGRIYILDGKEAFAPYEAGMGCADGVHPNDFGMWVYAENIARILKNELGFKECEK